MRGVIKDGFKTCTKCGANKPRTEEHFRLRSPDKKTGKRYFRSLCRSCEKDSLKTWEKENRTKRLEQKSDNRLRGKYGITLKDYYKMLKSQGGGCDICGDKPKEGGLRFHVDHNHKTGKVRGILCSCCNTAIGKLKEDPLLFLKSIDYLKKHS